MTLLVIALLALAAAPLLDRTDARRVREGYAREDRENAYWASVRLRLAEEEAAR